MTSWTSEWPQREHTCVSTSTYAPLQSRKCAQVWLADAAAFSLALVALMALLYLQNRPNI